VAGSVEESATGSTPVSLDLVQGVTGRTKCSSASVCSASKPREMRGWKTSSPNHDDAQQQDPAEAGLGQEHRVRRLRRAHRLDRALPICEETRTSVFVAEQNHRHEAGASRLHGSAGTRQPKEEAFVVFRIDAARDIRRLVYGGPVLQPSPAIAHRLLHSWTEGKNLEHQFSLTRHGRSPGMSSTTRTVEFVPAGTRSVLIKYLWNSSRPVLTHAASTPCAWKPTTKRRHDVAFRWKSRFVWNEVQEIAPGPAQPHATRRPVPARYTLNVGRNEPSGGRVAPREPTGHGWWTKVGTDFQAARMDWKSIPPRLPLPAVRILRMAATWAARSSCRAGDVRQESGRGQALYRLGAKNPVATIGAPAVLRSGKKLTDGIVGSPNARGYRGVGTGCVDRRARSREVTVDLGSVQTCGAFAFTDGYPFWDALRGEVKKTKSSVLTSQDGQSFASHVFFA